MSCLQAFNWCLPSRISRKGSKENLTCACSPEPHSRVNRYSNHATEPRALGSKGGCIGIPDTSFGQQRSGTRRLGLSSLNVWTKHSLAAKVRTDSGISSGTSKPCAESHRSKQTQASCPCDNINRVTMTRRSITSITATQQGALIAQEARPARGWRWLPRDTGRG